MKRQTYIKFFTYVLFLVLLFSSCASKKKVSSITADKELVEKAEQQKQNKELFKKVSENTLTSDALTSKMKFTVQAGQKSMSVAGQLEMKNDKYIRIRLTPLGLFEVAMIEFTSDYVLVLDRMHKEYIKADYSQVPFLQANGIDFHALQSLFRNKVFVPGEKHAGDDSYKKFDIHDKGSNMMLTAHKGNIDYNWFIDKAGSKINKTEFTYISKSNISTLSCNYSDFAVVAGKQFPHKLVLSFTTNMTKDFSSLVLMVSAKKFRTEQKGDGEVTAIPRKYEEKDVSEMLTKLLDVK